MEMKKALKPSRIAHPTLSLALLLACAPFAETVSAQEFLCQATQASHQELPVLDKTCPIGKGVWGKKVPQGGNLFWVQCGLLPKKMPLAKAKPLYNKISTDVWMKPEDKGFRCLIGPYKSFEQASTDLVQVRTVSGYKEAFIRVVGANIAEPVKKTKSVSKPKPVAKNTSAFEPKPAAVNVPEATPSTKVKPAEPVSVSNNVEVRLKAILQGKTYVVPYLLDAGNQFYMEYGKPWNRLSYASSQQVCGELGMGLVSSSEFKALRDSGVMEKNEWPLQLPYWGENRLGLFADREPNPLTGISLLNVMCVK